MLGELLVPSEAISIELRCREGQGDISEDVDRKKKKKLKVVTTFCFDG